MRNAIVKYLMGIHGIIDPYFNYPKINTFLQRAHKAYAKKIMCTPQKVEPADFEEFEELTAEDRCHISILVMESRKQIELIYFTHTLSQLIQI